MCVIERLAKKLHLKTPPLEVESSVPSRFFFNCSEGPVCLDQGYEYELFRDPLNKVSLKVEDQKAALNFNQYSRDGRFLLFVRYTWSPTAESLEERLSMVRTEANNGHDLIKRDGEVLLGFDQDWQSLIFPGGVITFIP